MLKFFSASTSVVNSRRAIAECIENALGGEETLDCDLLIIYTGIGHNFKELISEARRICPSAQIAGCTCAGVIGREGPDESLKALAVMAIKGPENEFAVASLRSFVDDKGVPVDDPVRLVHQMAEDLKGRCPGINMIFFHPGIWIGYIPKHYIGAIESVFGPDVPVLGGVSFDNMKLITNFQFAGDQVFEKGAVMIGFADPEIEVISHANHGLEIIGDPFVVTRSYKNFIYELDGKPAWKRYTEKLGLPESTTVSNVIALSPLAGELPGELHEEYGSRYYGEGPVPLPDKSIIATQEYPEGVKLWLTVRNENRINEGVQRLMIEILDRCEGRKPLAVFHADCVVRGKLTFDRIMKEEIVGQLQYPLCKNETIPWLGMYGAGEFAPMSGKNHLHLFTSALYVIVRRKPAVEKDKPQLQPEVVTRSKLFDKTRIRNITLNNRFVSSATWHGNASLNGSPSPMLVTSLLPVARGETGLIIGEFSYVSRDGVAAPGQLGIYDDTLLPGLSLMTEFVHRAGAPIVIQLVHGGLLSSPLLSGSIPPGPSPLETPDGIMGKEMSKADIDETVSAFRDAAVRARNAGFDGVQVHAAHGFLLSQFLSPFFNKRTDKYGGSIENRARILLDVTGSIREAVGDQFCILVKINSDDFLEGGFSTDEMLQVSAMLEKSGVDAIEISGGTQLALLAGNIDGSFSPAGRQGVYYREAARRLKEKVDIPVILVGGIRDFETADELVRTETADYISLSRPLIREPGLISRWKSGDLRKSACISDSACFQPGIEGKGVHCVHTGNSNH